MAPHYKNEAEHDTNTEVDPLVCHGGYHFPGIFARVVPLHTVGMADKNSCYIYIYTVMTDVLKAPQVNLKSFTNSSIIYNKHNHYIISHLVLDIYNYMLINILHLFMYFKDRIYTSSTILYYSVLLVNNYMNYNQGLFSSMYVI